MNFLTGRFARGFDSLLARILVKRFGILSSNAKQKNECPELEMLAAYLEHNLSINQMRKVEGHLVECRLCREITISVFKSQKFIPNPTLPEAKKQ